MRYIGKVVTRILGIKRGSLKEDLDGLWSYPCLNPSRLNRFSFRYSSISLTRTFTIKCGRLR